jgi:hypothetical protein
MRLRYPIRTLPFVIPKNSDGELMRVTRAGRQQNFIYFCGLSAIDLLRLAIKFKGNCAI